ncbi:hypothetical protein GH714_032663 [Hevea brasiliensis]|uniref:BURP domain-containing protein n=1 Tax=Hevea brasiliensis TaxID=3981 RepID=A0A6A6LU01_HEVBR|nr:hypothetical protein GH714_032663 [Hevea brasiliensis]
MPKAVKDPLQPDFVDEKSTSVGVGKGGVNVNTGKGKPGGTSVNVGNGGANVNTGHKGKPVYVGVNPKDYNRFSVKQGSMEAEIIKNTIRECEEPGIKGEVKYCATSLESMIDFSTSVLGKNVQVVSTEAENQNQLQKYTITDGTKKMAGDKSVVCHKQNYAYAVFYCHATQPRGLTWFP